MFVFIQKRFVGLLSLNKLLAGTVNVSNHKKFVSLKNQPCRAKPTLITLNADNTIKHCFTIHLWLI